MKPIILITGATDGIGLALARLYSQSDVQLVLIGRRSLDLLDTSFFTTSNYCQADLSLPNCADLIEQWLVEQSIQKIDLLIQNAGIGFIGSVSTQSTANIQEMLWINLQTPIALTHRLFPKVQAAQGKIIFVSSIASSLPVPKYAVYAATKAALDGFVRNLQIELGASDSGVTAQLIHLGATRTGMHEKSGALRHEMKWERFTPAETVAKKMIRVMDSKRRMATIGFGNGLLHLAGVHLSRPIEWAAKRGSKSVRSVKDRTPPTKNLAQPHCVITGAADGIGKALAQQFANAGYQITGIDIDKERAEQTVAEFHRQGQPIKFIIANLVSKSGVEQVLEQLAHGPMIDLLIHNAGINAVGPFISSSLAKQQAVIDLNLTAPLILTARLLEAKKFLSGGTIVFISSLSHFVSYPGAAVYAASKDALHAYASSLSLEVAEQGGQVVTVYPGPTRTAHARRYSPDNSREQQRMTPEQLAQRVAQAVHQRQRTVIPGMGNRAFATVGRLFPKLTASMMRRLILDKLSA